MLSEHVMQVEERIQKACERAGRSRDEITLIAVSKTKPVSDIEEVMSTGIVDFSENKVQELKEKYEILPKNLRWHMIGHLQRNKVKYLPGRTVLIHSVDSLRLAEEISREYARYGAEADILLEVNAAGEISKFGVSPEETEELARQIAVLPNVHIKGLMTIAPYTDDPEESRVYFKNLRQLSVDIAEKNIDNVSMSELSMGMTGDFETAIEEGATLIRVGTAIFGERNYNI